VKIQIVRHHVLWRFFYFRRSTDEDIELINKKLGPPGPEPKGQSGPRTARSHQYRQYKKPPGPSALGPPITGQDYVTRNPHTPPWPPLLNSEFNEGFLQFPFDYDANAKLQSKADLQPPPTAAILLTFKLHIV
jgi:hypothetical protein